MVNGCLEAGTRGIWEEILCSSAFTGVTGSRKEEKNCWLLWKELDMFNKS